MSVFTSASTNVIATYDPTSNLLLGHWPAQVTDELLRADYLRLLALAQRHGNCRFWLFNISGRNWHTPPFGQWFSTDFAQAIQAALGLPVFLAYVLDAAHRPIASSVGVQATQRGCSTYGLYPFFFDSDAAAREWLRHQQAHDVKS